MAHELHELPRIGVTSNEKFLQGVQPRGAGCPRRPFGPSGELLNCSSQLFAPCLNLSYELRAKSQELTRRVPPGKKRGIIHELFSI
jgi:hypothetical protein